jgi:nucleoside-diphosphate-sugar epimerase
MRILVTGGAGFIGTHLVRKLLMDNPASTVRILDNLHRGCNVFNGLPRVEFVQGDIRERQNVRAASQDVDVIYHLAAQSRVLGAIEDADYSFTTNVVGTVEVLSAARDCGVHTVVFTSSREVYGQATSLPVPESAPLHPKNAYGASKAAGEIYCRLYAESGMNVIVLRLANVYGPGDSGRVIPLFIANALCGRPLVIHGENKLLDFVWVGDVVDALASMLVTPLDRETVNIGSGEGTTLLDLAHQILDLTASSSTIASAGARTPEVDRFVADVRLAERLFNYRPSAPMAQLSEVAAAFRR